MKNRHQELRALNMNLLIIFKAIHRNRKINTAAEAMVTSPLTHQGFRLNRCIRQSIIPRKALSRAKWILQQDPSHLG